MKRYSILWKTLRDHAGAGISVAVTSALIGVLDLLIYPSYSKQLQDFQMPDAFKALIGEATSIASPPGFITAEYFSWIPLLVIVVAIIAGTAAIAGEEAAGTLEFLLAQPVSRKRLLLQKAGALSLLITLVILVPYPLMVAMMLLTDFDLGWTSLLATTVNIIPISLLFLCLALWCSAALPTRSAAALTSGGVVVVTFFLNTIGALVGVLDQPRKISPFYWADSSRILISGFDWLRAIAMLLIAGVFLALAAWSFQRREVSSGGKEINLKWLRRRRANALPPSA
ncbi:MAG TPA: ABC transporter permease subunit [Tepidiformaceae bacterium]|jgi:ABC-2 type transport system permease protein